jgi:SpoVK/Ycf46/Vps4 family AAA+-type ATPase
MDDSRDLEENLEILIRARYPILYLVSSEEDRVMGMLRRIAERRQKEVFDWSVTEGLQGLDPSAQDPQRALGTVLRDRKERSALYVFKDLHMFMNDPVVVRRLRDLALHLKTTLKTAIILSPVLRLVPELDKDVTVVDIPLPAVKELGSILEQILASVDDSIREAVSPAEKETIVKGALGLTCSEAQNVFAECLVRHRSLDLDTVVTAKEQIIKKSGILEFFQRTERFSNVGGLAPLKAWLEKRRFAFTDKAREFGLPPPRGVLLFGIQGCGKSLIAKSVAGIWRVPLLRMDVGKIFSGIVGSSETNIRKAISLAESVAPCVLWIDEMEKGFSGTRSSDYSDAGTTARVFSTFLTWQQEKTAPVFVVATSNDIHALPPELLRKGRFDELFFVDLPSPSERKEILRIHLAKRNRDPEAFDIDALAAETPGFSGAELEQAIVDALFAAFEAGRELNTLDVLEAVRRTVPLSQTMRETIGQLRELARARAVRASADESDFEPPARKLEM